MLPTIPTTTGYPTERTHYTPAELAEMTLREIVAVRTQAPEISQVVRSGVTLRARR